MAEDASLLRLMSWLSPAFPVGAFAYSHGLEQAINDGLVKDRASLVDWLSDLIECGSGWNDAVLLAETWRVTSSGGDCAEVAELAEALAGSKERHMETTLQGTAFADAVVAWEFPSPLRGGVRGGGVYQRTSAASSNGLCCSMLETPPPLTPPLKGEGNPAVQPYPVSIGIAAARHGIPLPDTLAAFLHAFTSNLIQATVRLLPLGQRDGVRALAELEPLLVATAARAARSTLDDLGSCSVMSEIMSMKHEVLYSRVFRS